MKKNAMLKIAAVLLVAVLLTTCAISSTFAKYVTAADDYTATARVAAWNIESNTTVDGVLFDKVYSNSNGQVGSVAIDEFLMAPGTSGSVKITNEITGTPEVSAKIVYDASCALDLKGNSDVTEAAFLARIKLQYRINGSGNFVDCTAISDLNTAIEENLSDTVAPGEDAAATKVVEIKWDWAFDDNTSDNEEEDGLDAYDKFDVKIAKTTPELAIAFTVAIEQTGGAGAADGQ